MSKLVINLESLCIIQIIKSLPYEYETRITMHWVGNRCTGDPALERNELKQPHHRTFQRT